MKYTLKIFLFLYFKNIYFLKIYIYMIEWLVPSTRRDCCFFIWLATSNNHAHDDTIDVVFWALFTANYFHAFIRSKEFVFGPFNMYGLFFYIKLCFFPWKYTSFKYRLMW
jgi:hypothetical protein